MGESEPFFSGICRRVFYVKDASMTSVLERHSGPEVRLWSVFEFLRSPFLDGFRIADDPDRMICRVVNR